MNLETEKIKINLVPTTKKIVNMTKQFKSKNLNELIFNAIQESDIEILAEIIKNFAEDTNGKSPFNGDINKVYDFIDDYKKENEKDYESLFRIVAEVVNEMGFFVKKMTKEELDKMLTEPQFNINMNEIVNNSAKEAMKEIVAEEFRGYKA